MSSIIIVFISIISISSSSSSSRRSSSLVVVVAANLEDSCLRKGRSIFEKLQSVELCRRSAGLLTGQMSRVARLGNLLSEKIGVVYGDFFPNA